VIPRRPGDPACRALARRDMPGYFMKAPTRKRAMMTKILDYM
jgi:hypothetical protein